LMGFAALYPSYDCDWGATAELRCSALAWQAIASLP
jgi:hypothetical protein